MSALTIFLCATGVYLLAIIGDEVMRRMAAADKWN